MGAGKDIDREDWESELIRTLARRLPGLDREVFRPTRASTLVDASLSVRPWRGRFLAVVRGVRVDGGGAIVCFGAGEDPLYALRNVSAACQKREFKTDQYAAGWEHVDQRRETKAVPLNGEDDS